MKSLRAPSGRDALSDVLETVRFRGAIFCRSELTAPWGFSVLSRDFASFHVVTLGSACLDVDGVDGRFWLSEGDLVILPRGNAHTVRDAPSSRATRLEELIANGVTDDRGMLRCGGGGVRAALLCGGFHFENGASGPLLASLPPVIHLRGRRPAVNTWLQMTLAFLTEEAASGRPGADTVVTRLADMLFIEAVRGYFSAPDAHRLGLAAALREPRIATALVSIHRQPETDWDVVALASQVAMSRTAFSNRFRELVGESPFSYVTSCRMNKASALLLSGTATIAQIARRVGYHSEASFSRAFKRRVGASPAAYRSSATSTNEIPSSGSPFAARFDRPSKAGRQRLDGVR